MLVPLDPELDPHFEEAARLNNLDPTLLRALAMGESSGNARALSGKGAGGLMQFIPSTAAAYGVTDVNDPVQSIYGAGKLLNNLLTDAEQKKAAGRDINPVEHALKGYFAGNEGPDWGPKTAAYPGYIASHYRALQGQQQPRGGDVTVGEDSGQPYVPPSGIDRLAALGANPRRVQMASAGPSTEATMTDEGSQSIPGGGTMNTVSAPLSGVDALAQAGRGPQVAQAGAALPSDDELLKGFVDGTLPFLQKPTAPAASTPAAGGAHPAFDVQGFVDTYNRYRAFPAGVPLANSALQALIKMAPESYVLNTDGSLTARSGGPADPDQARAVEAAKAAGGGTDVASKMAVETHRGDVATAENLAKQKAISERTPTTITIGGREYPVTQEQYADLTKRLNIPEVAAGAAGGAPNATGPNADQQSNVGKSYFTNPQTEGEKTAAEQFGKHREAFVANQGTMQNLQNFLEAAATTGTGKGTELSGQTAAWLKSIGVDPQKLSLADPAEVEKMRKASTQMIFQQIKGVSSRPAYQEFQMLAQGNPNPDLQPEANRAIGAALLGRMQWENQMFKDWDVDRRKTGLHANFDLPSWAEAHPMPGFQSSAYATVPAIPEGGVVRRGAPQPTKEDIQRAMERRGMKP